MNLSKIRNVIKKSGFYIADNYKILCNDISKPDHAKKGGKSKEYLINELMRLTNITSIAGSKKYEISMIYDVPTPKVHGNQKYEDLDVSLLKYINSLYDYSELHADLVGEENINTITVCSVPNIINGLGIVDNNYARFKHDYDSVTYKLHVSRAHIKDYYMTVDSILRQMIIRSLERLQRQSYIKYSHHYVIVRRYDDLDYSEREFANDLYETELIQAAEQRAYTDLYKKKATYGGEYIDLVDVNIFKVISNNHWVEYKKLVVKHLDALCQFDGVAHDYNSLLDDFKYYTIDKIFDMIDLESHPLINDCNIVDLYKTYKIIRNHTMSIIDKDTDVGTRRTKQQMLKQKVNASLLSSLQNNVGKSSGNGIIDYIRQQDDYYDNILQIHNYLFGNIGALDSLLVK